MSGERLSLLPAGLLPGALRSERALAVPSARWRDPFWELATDLFAVYDGEGRLQKLNPAWERTLGWSLEELGSRAGTDFLHPDDVGRSTEKLKLAALAGVRLDGFENRMRCRDGSYRTVSCSGFLEHGSWFVVGEDITDQALEAEVAHDFWQSTLDSLPEQVAVIDDAGLIIAVNTSWRRFGRDFGGSGTSIGQSYLAACDKAAPDRFARNVAVGLRAMLRFGQTGFSVEYPCHDQSGERWFVMTATRFLGAGGVSVVISHHDVTSRRQMEARLRAQGALLDEIDVAVVATDTSRVVTLWNRGAEQLYGWTRAEAIGRVVGDLVIPDDPSSATALADLYAHAQWDGRVQLSRKDLSTFPAHVRSVATINVDGEEIGRISVSIDMSAEVEAEEASAATRNYLHAVTNSMGEGLFALDEHGRIMLMNRAAERLLGWTSQELHGLVLHDVTHHQTAIPTPATEDAPLAKRPSDRVVTRVDEDTFIRRDGAALPVAYTSAPLDAADGRQGSVVVFSDATHQIAERDRLQGELEEGLQVARVQAAIREDRLLLYAQPIVALETMAVVQRELLLRVQEPDGSIVAPAEYLAIAERNGLIGEIDRWVIARGTDIAATGRPVELNVSAYSVSDSDIVTYVESCLSESGADPSSLVFEITETAILNDVAAAATFVKRLHELGCKIALDDFGTGFGGFTYLKQLPVDYLKIDIEFVRDLPTNPASSHVVRAVVSLARDFELETVAEGVEDEETLNLLRTLGVDYAQGFHIARPSPQEASTL